MMDRGIVATELALRFVLQLVASGVTTAWLIVRPSPRPVSGLVRMRFSRLSASGAALLGCMVTLTPGATIVDVDMQRQELLLHLLDTSSQEATVAAIRSQFEHRLRRLFPAKESRR